MRGLQCGKDNRNVPLLPIIRSAVYAADSINIKSEVWATEFGDVY
jgi:hypothetical protein